MATAKRKPKTPATRPPPSTPGAATSSAARTPEVAYHFPIVAIGASAGGLEALTSLLKELSPDLGMAFIVVLHLDPARESAVTQILSRATRMPVLQVTDGMQIAPDHVYVIPPNCDMTIAHWVLHLRKRDEPRSANTTIDTFLRSLAVGHGHDAIGVILSGTASDGTLGLAAVSYTHLLERVPANLAEFKPHEKSMPMGRLAMHVATLPRFASAILTVERMDLATEKFPPNTFESTEAVVRTFEQASSELRSTLARQSDADLQRKWTMVFGDKPIVDAPRSLLFRTMYLNHQIHHRAQLGVYLRLKDVYKRQADTSP